jgi:hypothetical protein
MNTLLEQMTNKRNDKNFDLLYKRCKKYAKQIQAIFAHNEIEIDTYFLEKRFVKKKDNARRAVSCRSSIFHSISEVQNLVFWHIRLRYYTDKKKKKTGKVFLYKIKTGLNWRPN